MNALRIPNQRHLAYLLALWMAVLATAARAQISPSSSTELTANGSASIAAGGTCGGSVLLLTPAEQYQAGSVFTTNPVPFNRKYAFRTFFQFQMSYPNSQASDGMAFVIQAQGSDALGANGGSLGYGGITPSVAVEFDTFQNPGDPSDNYVAILTDGVMTGADPQIPYGVTACQPSTGLYGCMNNGDLWSVWVDYDGTNINVAIADNSTTRPANLISYPIDISSILGQAPAFVGFSAGTGFGFERHVVANWLFL